MFPITVAFFTVVVTQKGNSKVDGKFAHLQCAANLRTVKLGHVPLHIPKSACQRCTNLPKIYKTPQNSGRQKCVRHEASSTLRTPKYQEPPQKIQPPW